MSTKISKFDIKIYEQRLRNNSCKCKLNGYEIVFCPEHPNSYKKGHVYKHRLIKELEIGRYLTKDEVIHHKNEDRTDNDNNLEILNHGQHNNKHKATEFWKLICPWCKEEFVREKRIVKRNWKKKCFGPFCSKSCSAFFRERVNKKVKAKIMDKFKKRKKSKFYI